MSAPSPTSAPHVAIVGGGLAGLASATALAERGVRVELFEARRKLGGRAGSFVDQASGDAIDHCQHVAMGCCTNFLDFCNRTGLSELFTRHQTLHFFGPDGWRSDFRPARWLPAPLHLGGALFRLKFLSLGDKLGIARAMLRLMKLPATDEACGPTVSAWLQERQQSAATIERFWQVVLVSALGESLERASLAAARKVFLDGFLAHRDASHVVVPQVSLSNLYERVVQSLQSRGVVIHLGAPVACVAGTTNRLAGVQLVDGTERTFDFVILAVPWDRVGGLLPGPLHAAIDPGNQFAAFGSAPITSVHLWFDRPLTDLPHAVLVGRLSQWVFARTAGTNQHSPPTTHYYQIVISASHNLAGRDRQAIVDEVIDDLRAVFPATANAKLLRWQLITQRDAVFSVRPGLDAIRPPQQTAIPNLLLAGDWTRTGWPATMESAVRSGYLAAESVLKHLGRPERIVVPDLPRGWLVKVPGLRASGWG